MTRSTILYRNDITSRFNQFWSEVAKILKGGIACGDQERIGKLIGDLADSLGRLAQVQGIRWTHHHFQVSRQFFLATLCLANMTRSTCQGYKFMGRNGDGKRSSATFTTLWGLSRRSFEIDVASGPIDGDLRKRLTPKFIISEMKRMLCSHNRVAIGTPSTGDGTTEVEWTHSQPTWFPEADSGPTVWSQNWSNWTPEIDFSQIDWTQDPQRGFSWDPFQDFKYGTPSTADHGTAFSLPSGTQNYNSYLWFEPAAETALL
jgi:hypothetical protein